MTKSRLLYVTAAVVVALGVAFALVVVKTRYSCGEGWDVHVTSRSAALSMCSAGDVPPPTVGVDLALALRALIMLLGLAIATLPLRLASNASTESSRGPRAASSTALR